MQKNVTLLSESERLFFSLFFYKLYFQSPENLRRSTSWKFNRNQLLANATARLSSARCEMSRRVFGIFMVIQQMTLGQHGEKRLLCVAESLKTGLSVSINLKLEFLHVLEGERFNFALIYRNSSREWVADL